MNVKEWPKNTVLFIEPDMSVLDEWFQTGFQKLNCRNVFILQSLMLKLNKFVFLKITGLLRAF